MAQIQVQPFWGVQQTGLSRAWLASVLMWDKGKEWRKCHPSFIGRQVGQGNQFPCFSTGEWFILLAAVFSAVQRRRCNALLKHSLEVPDEDKTFVHRYNKVCTALGSISVILLSLVRMWCHIIAKNLASKSEGGAWTGMHLFSVKKKKKKKKKILNLWLARALSFLRICPEGIQVIVSWMH